MSAFDGLSFAQGLREVGIPPDQAEALAKLIRDQVLANAATKGDVLNLEQRLDAKVDQLAEKVDRIEERLRAEIRSLGQQMTIKLGSMLVVAVGIIVATQKLW